MKVSRSVVKQALPSVPSEVKIASTRVELDGLEKRAPVRDGVAFVKAALLDIRARTSRGEKVRVAFDIDDTLADTRARTLSIAKAWDTAHGTHLFDRLTLEQVGHDGLTTAAAMGLSGPDEAAFSAHWNTAFWDGEHFSKDLPIPVMVELAKQAKAAGAEVEYVTGRIAALGDFTVDELKRFGLPDADAAHLQSKPDLLTRTVPFKAEWLKQSAADGYHLAFFVTESRRDIAGVQALSPGCQCLLLDAPTSGVEAVREDTPVFPRAVD